MKTSVCESTGLSSFDLRTLRSHYLYQKDSKGILDGKPSVPQTVFGLRGCNYFQLSLSLCIIYPCLRQPFLRLQHKVKKRQCFRYSSLQALNTYYIHLLLFYIHFPYIKCCPCYPFLLWRPSTDFELSLEVCGGFGNQVRRRECCLSPTSPVIAGFPLLQQGVNIFETLAAERPWFQHLNRTQDFEPPLFDTFGIRVSISNRRNGVEPEMYLPRAWLGLFTSWLPLATRVRAPLAWLSLKKTLEGSKNIKQLCQVAIYAVGFFMFFHVFPYIFSHRFRGPFVAQLGGEPLAIASGHQLGHPGPCGV